MRRSLLPLLALFTLVLAACGGDDASSGAAGASDGADRSGEDDGHDAHGGEGDIAADARPVDVIGSSLAFDPPQLQAEIGEDIAVTLTSQDVEHDFTIDELDAHVAADAGEAATGGFDTGDEAGEYTYYCSVPGHREAGMEGTLVVG